MTFVPLLLTLVVLTTTPDAAVYRAADTLSLGAVPSSDAQEMPRDLAYPAVLVQMKQIILTPRGEPPHRPPFRKRAASEQGPGSPLETTDKAQNEET